MTIKEIETLSEMTRANIRFYESEGLLSPEKSDNGYRNYSDADLVTLQRIKLLRSLQVPIDQISKLQTGELALPDALSERIIELEKVKNEADYAHNICQAIRNDNAAYSTLDAPKYLSGIPKSPEPRSYFNIESDREFYVFKPWRRYLSRMLDMMIYSLIWQTVLALVFHKSILTQTGLGTTIRDSYVALILMLFIEPLWLMFFCTTPGKAIFGLRLTERHGNAPSYSNGFWRTFAVITSGMGAGIPYFNIYKLWKSYKSCKNNEPLQWDDDMEYTLKDMKGYRGVLLAGAVAVTFLLTIGINLLAQIPPYRGDITISEFAKNYNRNRKYYEISEGYELNSEGQWLQYQGESEFDTTYFVYTVPTEDEPEISFTTDGDIITEITWRRTVRSDINFYRDRAQLQLMLLSFVGAQKGIGLFGNTRSQLLSHISDFNSTSFSEAGVNVELNVSFGSFEDFEKQFQFDETRAGTAQFDDPYYVGQSYYAVVLTMSKAI